jgi:hypothetical protein
MRIRVVGMRGAVGIGLIVFAAGCGGDEATKEPSAPSARDSRGDCDIGARHKWWSKVVEHRTIVLACGEAQGGQRIRIGAFEDDAGPCLVIFGTPRVPRQCGRTPSESIPPRPEMTADAIAQVTPKSPLELYGALRPVVREVVVRFRLPSGKRATRSAPIIRVHDAEALRAAHIREPFGYFVAFVPPGARNVVATGRDAHGAVLGRLRYDPIVDSLHPHNFIALQLSSTTR